MTPPEQAPPRSDAITYQQILDTDTRPVPDVLRRTGDVQFTDADIPVTRYTSRSFHELEKEKLWSRVWQMACRSEDIPEVGDTHRYDIADRSYLIVRTAPDVIKGYYNACLHRGRMLREHDGRVEELRCPFHGFCWELDGRRKQVPSGWDFPHVYERAGEFQLPEVRVDTWGGFVFINPDENCESLAAFLGELPDHFADWDLENRYKSAHVAKVVRCNWKVASEAFSEALHVVATHPQILANIGDAITQYDVWGNSPTFTRGGHSMRSPTASGPTATIMRAASWSACSCCPSPTENGRRRPRPTGSDPMTNGRRTHRSSGGWHGSSTRTRSTCPECSRASMS